MSTVPIKVPKIGESISEGILSKWLKADGSAVVSGEPIFELETDKASTVVSAPASGVLKILATEGDTVAIGATIGTVDPAGAASSPSPSPAAAPEGQAAKAAEPALSPSVRRIVAESNVDVSKVEGTGRGGRVTKGDVIDHLAAKEAPEPEPPPTAVEAAPSSPRETRQRMSGIRRTIAQRLVEAQQTAAILTTFNEADVTRISDLRARYKDAFKTKHGVNLGYSSFFVKAVVEALKSFPTVNARIDGNDIVHHHYYDIGVAVSTDRGLMVPVLRDADAMSFASIEKKIAEFASKAREGTIAIPDLQGGTFTITNGGVFGSLLSTPILNPPQSGILGMHAIQKRPVAIDDQVVIRPMMYLALSYDHRIIDGREAVSFLVRIKECVENPERLLLDI